MITGSHQQSFMYFSASAMYKKIELVSVNKRSCCACQLLLMTVAKVRVTKSNAYLSSDSLFIINKMQVTSIHYCDKISQAKTTSWPRVLRNYHYDCKQINR